MLFFEKAGSFENHDLKDFDPTRVTKKTLRSRHKSIIVDIFRWI